MRFFHRSETGSSIINKQLYVKGKECRNALQGQFRLVLLCTFCLVNATSSLVPNKDENVPNLLKK